jgi:hypothetical protein
MRRGGLFPICTNTRYTRKLYQWLTMIISLDLNPLFIIIISLRLDMLLRLEGRQPWNFLLASTMTDIEELPKLSRRSNLNRLWLMKMASNGSLKSSFGTVPSNSLNLRSRNLNCGSFKTTSWRFLEQPFHHPGSSRVDPEVQIVVKSAVN